MESLQDKDTRWLNLKAIGLRNRRDAFSHGSRHAEEVVQELHHVERELARRREERRAQREAEAEAREAAVVGPFTVESYETDSGPTDKRVAPNDLIGPPGSLGMAWPTGFAGGGWVVRDARGVYVFASAWRVECLNYVEAKEAI